MTRFGLLLALILVGCVAPIPPTPTYAPVETAPPTFTPTRTASATPTRDADSTATALAHVMETSHARATEDALRPLWTPTITPTYEPCATGPMTFSLAWSDLQTPNGPVRQLAGLEHPAIVLEPSPDGRWLIAVLQTGDGQGGPQTATALIDPQGDTHYWLNREHWSNRYPYEWLPDSRLLWFDETRCLYLGGPGSARLLGRFERLTETVTMGSVAFLYTHADSSPLRLDLETGAVDTLVPGEHASAYGVGVANDGEYALSLHQQPGQDLLVDHQIWRFDPVMGAPPEQLGSFAVEIAGRDGGRWIPPQQLGSSVYWFLPVFYFGADRGTERLIEGVIVDMRDGRIIGRDQFPLPEQTYILGYEVSPDGDWLAVILADATAPPEDQYRAASQYITSTDYFDAGDVLAIPGSVNSLYRRADGRFYQWHPDDAVVLRDPEGQIVVARLPLSRGTVTLAEAGEWIANLPGGRVLTTAADSISRLLLYDLSGNMLASLDSGGSYGSFPAAARAGSIFYVSAAGPRPESGPTYGCPCALIEWEP